MTEMKGLKLPSHRKIIALVHRSYVHSTKGCFVTDPVRARRTLQRIKGQSPLPLLTSWEGYLKGKKRKSTSQAGKKEQEIKQKSKPLLLVFVIPGIESRTAYIQSMLTA